MVRAATSFFFEKQKRNNWWLPILEYTANVWNEYIRGAGSGGFQLDHFQRGEGDDPPKPTHLSLKSRNSMGSEEKSHAIGRA